MYGCANIETDYSITAAQLTAWNTWLSSNCDTSLYANLTDGNDRPVCVGVNASATATGQASAPPSTTLPPKTGSATTASMGPTQTGVVAGCQKFYTVQSGDSCYNIEQTYAISFAQFYQWNPSGMSSSAFEIVRCLS